MEFCNIFSKRKNAVVLIIIIIIIIKRSVMVGSTKKLMMHALANIEFKRIVNRGGAIVMHEV